jgi:hypothetical protein
MLNKRKFFFSKEEGKGWFLAHNRGEGLRGDESSTGVP